MWTMPCDKEVNIAFMMGGKKIPIHPLDATLPFSDGVDPSRKDCFGSVCIQEYLIPLSTELG